MIRTPHDELEPEVSADAINYWAGWGGTYANQTWDQLQKTQEFKDLLKGQKFEIKGGLSADVFLTAVAGGTPPDGVFQEEERADEGDPLPIEVDEVDEKVIKAAGKEREQDRVEQ